MNDWFSPSSVLGRSANRMLVQGLATVAVLVVLLLSSCETAAQSMQSRLARRVDLEASNESFDEVVAGLARKAKVKIEFVGDDIAEQVSNTKVSLHLNKLPLGGVLNILMEAGCGPTGPLIWSAEPGKIVFAVVEDLEPLTVRNFDLRGLGAFLANPNQFRYAIMETASPYYWTEFTGEDVGGVITALTPTSMQVRNFHLDQIEIADLLTQLKSVASGRPALAIGSSTPTIARLTQSLQRPAKFSGDRIKLLDAIRETMDACRASWWVDQELYIASIDINAEVTIPDDKQSWGQALSRALAEHKLCFYPENDAVRVTTQEYFEAEERIRVFDVRKLPGSRSGDDFVTQLMQQPNLGPWLDVDGEGGVARVLGPVVILRHSINRHMQIEQLLSGK